MADSSTYRETAKKDVSITLSVFHASARAEWCKSWDTLDIKWHMNIFFFSVSHSI
jgi:hypothetical protein